MSMVIELAKNVEMANAKKEQARKAFEVAAEELELAKAELLKEMQLGGKTNGNSPSLGNKKVGRKSLKQIVKETLANTEGGQELKEITATIVQMIQRGEYKSKADNVSAIVAQALNSLKEEQSIVHDRQSKKYFAK